MGHGRGVRSPCLSIRFLFAIRQAQLFPRTILTLRVNDTAIFVFRRVAALASCARVGSSAHCFFPFASSVSHMNADRSGLAHPCLRAPTRWLNLFVLATIRR